MTLTELSRHLLDRHPLDIEPGSVEERLVHATLRCVARWGTAKTSLADVADEAGISRATLYRTFRDGKEGLLLRAATLEIDRFFDDLAERFSSAATLEDVIVRGMSSAGKAIIERRALVPLMTHFFDPQTAEREAGLRVLQHLVIECAAPHLARFLEPKRARATADLLARLVITFVLLPSDKVDVTDEDAVRGYVRQVLTLPATGFAR